MKYGKTKIATIALILTLTFAATFVTLPIVSAHDPPWEIPTWTLLTIAPNPVGVGSPRIPVSPSAATHRTGCTSACNRSRSWNGQVRGDLPHAIGRVYAVHVRERGWSLDDSLRLSDGA